jgi:hypothetical protein
MCVGKTSTKELTTTLEEDMELSKAERIRKARELYQNRKQGRPVQLTAPTSDHVIGWNWPKVDEGTIAEIQERLDDIDED